MRGISRLHSPRAPGIRLQITLWYTAVFTLLLVLVGAVTYANTSASLGANIDSNLALRARQIAAGISDINGRFFIEDVSGALPELNVAGSPTPTPAASSRTSTPTAAVAPTHTGAGTPVATSTGAGTPAATATRTPTRSDDAGGHDDDTSGLGSDEQHEREIPSVNTGALVRILSGSGALMYCSPAAQKLTIGCGRDPQDASRALGG